MENVNRYRTTALLQARVQERATDGRDTNPIAIKVHASVTGEGQKSRTIVQSQGDPNYDVIRQEYEDVRYGPVGTDPADHDPYDGPGEADTLPNADKFTTQSETIPHSADFPTARFNGETIFHSDFYPWHIVQENVINGLRNSIQNMTQQERQAVRGANEFFYVYSNFRSPAENKASDGVGNSTHMEGRAVDIDTLDPINGIGVNHWNRFYRRQNLTNCAALARFLRQEAGATYTQPDGDLETNCPDGDHDGTQDESKVHAAWP